MQRGTAIAAVAFLSLVASILIIQSVRFDEFKDNFIVKSNNGINLPLTFNSTRFKSCKTPFAASLEELEGKFGPKAGKFFYHYAKMHREIMCNDNGTMAETDRRVLIMVPSAGLANRVQSMVSGFLVAALTNRALWIDWELTGSFNCEFENIWETLLFDATLDDEKRKLWTEWQKIRSTTRGRIHDPESRITIHSPDADYWLCGDYRDHFGIDSATGSPLTFVRLATDESLLPMIIKIFRFLFEPKQEVKNIIHHRQSTLGPCDVGIHARIHGTTGLAEGELEEFWKCSIDDIMEDGRSPTASIFVASDTQETAQLLRGFSSSAKDSNISIYSLSQNVKEQWDQECSELSAALAEIYVLAGCRTVLGTSWSSFSMLAMVLAEHPERSKMVTHVERNLTSGQIRGTARERECNPIEYPGCTKIKRNGCVKHPIKHLCYLEYRHLKVFSCFTPEMFEEEECCKYGYCGEMCIHHTGYSWWSSWIFHWRVWHASRILLLIPPWLLGTTFLALLLIGGWKLAVTLPFKIEVPYRILMALSALLSALMVAVAHIILLHVGSTLVAK